MVDKFKKSDKCLYCENQMDAVYRNKRFCSNKCRVYWNREKPKVEVKNLNNQTTGLRETEKKAAQNESINNMERKTPEGYKYGQDFSVTFNKPQNLEQLKAMCPPELTGFEKSEWIATERQKYNI